MPTQLECLIEMRDGLIKKSGKDAPFVKALEQQISSAKRESAVTRLMVSLKKT